MSLINVISAIGNNSSIYPLLVRDCGIEIPSKVALTYNQNLKDSKQMAYNATRERLIDEYGTSAVWLGGIPLINKLCNKFIEKMGYNPNISMNLFKENSKQGLNLNTEKFKLSAPNEIKEIEKVLKNKKTYQRLQAGKFALSTAIPIALMGFVLPKLNFKLTEKLSQEQNDIQKKEQILQGNISFKGITSTLSNMSTVNKMAVTDGGLTVGRVTTARNKYEKIENGFKMTMMMFLNFVFPAYLAKGLNYITGKIFNTNVNLDPNLMNDKNFLKSINENSLKLPNSSIIDFIDREPESDFTKLCEKYCGVKKLKNGVRDPRIFVNEKVIYDFQKEIEKFAQEARKSGNINKYAKKALIVKSANILANIGISSFLLAVALPKAIFLLRKKLTGSDAEPGLLSQKREA